MKRARTGFNPKAPGRFIDNWSAIITEVGNRYGRGLAGWWFDDGRFYYPLNPDFKRLALWAKAGNFDRVIGFNSWIYPRFTDFQVSTLQALYKPLHEHPELLHRKEQTAWKIPGEL